MHVCMCVWGIDSYRTEITYNINAMHFVVLLTYVHIHPVSHTRILTCPVENSCWEEDEKGKSKNDSMLQKESSRKKLQRCWRHGRIYPHRVSAEFVKFLVTSTVYVYIHISHYQDPCTTQHRQQNLPRSFPCQHHPKGTKEKAKNHQERGREEKISWTKNFSRKDCVWMLTLHLTHEKNVNPLISQHTPCKVVGDTVCSRTTVQDD